VRGIKQTFTGQPGLHLFERQLQGSGSQRFNLVHNQLIAAPWFINRNSSVEQDFQSVFKGETDSLSHRAKHHARNLGIVILDIEVEMPGTRPGKIGNLALQKYLPQILFQKMLDLPGQLGDRQRR